MVDDLAQISVCGVESVKSNAYVNAQIEQNKLAFNNSKCHHMHSGKKSRLCPTLRAHETAMDLVKEEKYVGDIVSEDSKHTKNIISRRSNGIGVCNEITTILSNLCLGPHHFHVAVMLRQAMLLQVLLSNSETWLRLTKANMKKLESVDHMLLRKILDTAISTPINALYLECGCIPIRFIIKKKRIMFLHHILTRQDNSLITKVFWAQVHSPAPGDWCQVVREDLEHLGLDHLSYASIAEMTKYQLKKLLVWHVEETAAKYLENEKEKTSKTRQLHYPTIKLQPYLSSMSSLPIKMKQLYFRWRTQMIKVGWNYGNKTKCPMCTEFDDDQNHLFNCPYLTADGIYTQSTYLFDNDNLHNNSDDSDWDSIYVTLKRLEKAIRKRNIFLEEQELAMAKSVEDQ
jgi:hypothetical protein